MIRYLNDDLWSSIDHNMSSNLSGEQHIHKDWAIHEQIE